MYGDVEMRLQAELEAIRQAGLWKGERGSRGRRAPAWPWPDARS